MDQWEGALVRSAPRLLNALLSLKNRKSGKYGGEAKKDGRESETDHKIVEIMVQRQY